MVWKIDPMLPYIQTRLLDLLCLDFLKCHIWFLDLENGKNSSSPNNPTKQEASNSYHNRIFSEFFHWILTGQWTVDTTSILGKIDFSQKKKQDESWIAFAKSCILKVSQDFKTFLRSLARLSRLSRLLKLEKYTMNIV